MNIKKKKKNIQLPRQPKVSVIMPVFNKERYLKEAIKSILSQSFINFELIILDDGSTDNSFKVIKSFKDQRIKVFKSKKRQGLAKGLNFLIKKARAEYIARMDGDDLSIKDRLKLQTEFLDKNHEVALVGSWAKVIDGKANIIGQFKHPCKYSKIREVILSYNPFIHSSVCFRKKIFNNLRGYDEELIYSQDYDLFLRMAVSHKCVNIPEFLHKFRWLGDYKKQKKQHLTALKIRLKAVSQYNYKKWEVIKLLKPALYYLIPPKIKKIYWDNKFIKKKKHYEN